MPKELLETALQFTGVALGIVLTGILLIVFMDRLTKLMEARKDSREKSGSCNFTDVKHSALNEVLYSLAASLAILTRLQDEHLKKEDSQLELLHEIREGQKNAPNGSRAG